MIFFFSSVALAGVNYEPDIWSPTGRVEVGVDSSECLGSNTDACVGFVLTEPDWDGLFDSDSSSRYQLTSAVLYFTCEAEPAEVGATVRVALAATVSQSNDQELPTFHDDVVIEQSLAGCTGGVSVDIHALAERWLVEPTTYLSAYGLVVMGAEPASTHWSVPVVDRTSGGVYRPVVQLNIEEYADEDGDGYTEISGDCCDSAGSGLVSSPDVEEVCDGVDNDCDGVVDEDSDAETSDGDGDGFTTCGGYVDTTPDCAETRAWSSEPPDCNDLDDGVSPAELESCDGVDNDCDGWRDEGCPEDRVDNDLDGFREIDGDEDDSDPGEFPGARPRAEVEEPQEAGDVSLEIIQVETARCAVAPQGGWWWLGLLVAICRRRR